MKIAVSVGIGPLNKWGYQHTCQECLGSQAEFADHVYMVQSTQNSAGVKRLLKKYGNISLISNPSTWHHKPGESDDVLNVGRGGMAGMTLFHMRNLAIGRAAAFDDGIMIVLSTHNNWYIPWRNVEALRKHCEDFAHSGKTTGHTWMMPQLHNKLFGPGTVNEGLCNLAGHKNREKVLAYYPDMKWRHPPLQEIPANVGDICLVDVSYNLLPAEYEGMQHRFGYPEHEQFQWQERRAQLASRLLRRNVVLNVALDGRSRVALDYWGERIAAKSGPTWMGYQILQEAGLL